MPRLPALPPTSFSTEETISNFFRVSIQEFVPLIPRIAPLGRMSGEISSGPRGVIIDPPPDDPPIPDPDPPDPDPDPEPPDPDPEPEPPLPDPRNLLGNFDAEAHDHINNTVKVRYHADLSGGAHAHKWNGGVIGKAFTAFIGDTQHDTLLLEQIRHILIETNGHTCPGNYAELPQNVSSNMFALARHTPRIWNQLTVAEVLKIDRTMTAVLVTGAFITSDRNPFVLAETTEFSMVGNVTSRGWNPNISNPAVQSAIYGAMYFGAAQAKAILLSWDHQHFIDSLLGWGLQHIHRSYTDADPNAPTVTEINDCLHQDWTYFGIPLDDPLGLWVRLTQRLVTKAVNTGLNGGAGKMGSSSIGGYMANVAKRATLPNVGRTLSMFHEFETVDGSGDRSASNYTHDGWYTNLHMHAALVCLGYWRVNAETENALERILMASDDWLYKNITALGGGYTDYFHGDGRGVHAFPQDNDNSGRGHNIDYDLQRILFQWHTLAHGWVPSPDAFTPPETITLPVPRTIYIGANPRMTFVVPNMGITSP